MTVRSISLSIFTIRGASGAIPSSISSFACKIPAREPRFSMWDTPMLVISPTVGATARVKRLISPKWFMPISMTAAVWLSSKRNSI